MGQQERKAQEGAVVRRLTLGAGAAALGLAGYFTVAAATAAPIAFGAQSTAEEGPAVGSAEELDDRVFVRRVHVQAPPRPPVGGVKAVAGRTASGGQAAPVSAQPAGAGQAPAAVAPKPAPPPPPAATTGGSKPK